MYYSVLFVSSIVVFVLTSLGFSDSIPLDDLDSSTFLFDGTPSSSLFTDDDDFLTTTTTTTTAETLPDLCAADAASNDLSFTQSDETNLFSRSPENGAACLPPVNIGAESLQLFKDPLNLLENTLLPFKGQNSDDPSGSSGLPPSGESERRVNSENKNQQGWQPYTGGVKYDIPDSESCRELTAARGDYHVELCCDSAYAGPPTDGVVRMRLRMADSTTRKNSDFAVGFQCVRTSFLSLSLFPSFQSF